MDHVTYDPVLALLFARRDEFEEFGLHDRVAETQELIERRILTHHVDDRVDVEDLVDTDQMDAA